MKTFLFMLGVLVVCGSGRRIRVRPVGAVEGLENSAQQVEYYAEQEDDQGPVLVSRQDTYGRATGQARLQPKLKPDAHRAPPVQTIRNYNKLNDDGSFTFGYEAADGSFKEETRGTDCVVRGKYGYIDPDGNKREFTYVSGNPCDPNAIHQEEEEAQEPDSGEENIPQNIPPRPIKPLRPSKPVIQRPATTVFQQEYNSRENEEEQPEVRLAPRPQPQLVSRFPVPTFSQLEEELRPHVLGSRPTPRPKVLLTATPRQKSVSITPRPVTIEHPATTYRPQLVVTASPSPKPLRPSPTPSSTAVPSFEQEFKNFQLEHNVVSTPRPQVTKKPVVASNQPIYTSELVFDPSTGQYNTVVYQQLPQTSSDFSLRGRLQPYVAPQQYFQPARQQYIAPAVRPTAYPTQQQLFQQQQASLVQQSQQLFAQQQQKKLHTKPQALPQTLLRQEPQRFTPAPSQSFYYVAPPNGDRGAIAAGQIEAFLRGHSITL